jgi:flagellar biosynthesis anti-sigma factor FlgM
MRVNQSTSNAVSTETQGTQNAKKSEKSEKAAAAKAARPEKAEKSDRAPIEGSSKTEISSRAKEMAQAKDVAAAAPETREEKIAALKARIAAGRYEVDNEAVADRMVDDHLRMSGIG